MPKVRFIKEKQEIELPYGANLRDEALKAGIEIHRRRHKWLHCRGHGTCGTCRVLIKKGMENISRPGRLERFRLALALFAIGAEDEVRLSCQTKVLGDIEVETQPPLNLFGEPFWQGGDVRGE